MVTQPLWIPSAERIECANVTQFARKRGLPEDYGDLWQWSVDELEDFWAAVWDEWVEPDAPHEAVLRSRTMPGAEWFPGARLNYAKHVFRGRDPQALAIQHASETRELGAWTWGDLERETARIAAGLKELGVGRGDRVAAYLPNIPETVAAFLATASLGAVWSSCSPDFGARSVIDRFAQIEPKVLLAVRKYRYNGREFDRSPALEQITAAMNATTMVLGEPSWESLVEVHEPLAFERVPFDHPLWVLYSSGTTGLPKAIVQSQGG